MSNRRRPRAVLRAALLSLAAVGVAATAAEAQSTDALEGVWSADRYLLAEGSGHEVEGRIFFTGGHWQVLFFVMDGAGVARRGSGEGGTYQRTADGVVFSHLFHLSIGDAMPGLAEAPLRMVVQAPEEAPLEPTRVDVDDAILTLRFPSGNRMTFTRAGPLPRG
ncbi:MAG: hypothetical protein OEO23_00180 [Gemmatimonadota bacterium]|nr:hypothetical protein [Gemmatimonadota bacterium]